METFFPARSSLIPLMMEAVRTSETSVNSYQSTRHYNPEDGHVRTHRRENLKSYLAIINLITINQIIFVTEGRCVFFEVGTEVLNNVRAPLCYFVLLLVSPGFVTLCWYNRAALSYCADKHTRRCISLRCHHLQCPVNYTVCRLLVQRIYEDVVTTKQF
jgi:hypothetical protein